MDIGSIVLAGGKGLRLGRDKTQETIKNRTLLQRVVSRVSFLDGGIIIVTASEKQCLSQSINCPGLRMVADTCPGKGPLGGIYTGLAASDSIYNLVVACDMPFLNQALLNYMVQVSAGFEIVVPRLGSLVEPLHAIYSRGCLTPIERLLEQGTLSVSNLFALVKVRYVEADEINRFDPEHLSFFNINSGTDLKKAKELIRNGDDKC